MCENKQTNKKTLLLFLELFGMVMAGFISCAAVKSQYCISIATEGKGCCYHPEEKHE